MTNLEFINDKIKMQIVAIESAVKIVKEFEGIAPVDAYKKSIEVHEEEIQNLYQIKNDLEILEELKKHLYVASGLVELKITSQEYANIHNVKTHNGIPIVNQQLIDEIYKWYYSKNRS